jgi:uncharacterized coiled-coil DUF342 family protein
VLNQQNLILNKKVENNKYYITFDIKSIIILILSLVIVGIILFNPSKKEINKYETEINNLNKKNKELLFKNDSLKNVNRQLGNDILILTKKIDDINIELEDNENLIKRLKKKKGEIFSNVNSMDANGVTRSLSDYLKRRD